MLRALIHSSPVRLSGELHRDAALALRSLYAPAELISVVTASAPSVRKNGDIKLDPVGAGFVLPAGELATRIEAGKILESKHGAGVWWRPNPLARAVTRPPLDVDCERPRFLLLEADSETFDTQAATLMQLVEWGLPICTIYSSGGKSIHALLAVSSTDWRADAKRILKALKSIAPGLDSGNSNPSRLSRLPGARRGDAPQQLFWLRANTAPQSPQQILDALPLPAGDLFSAPPSKAKKSAAASATTTTTEATTAGGSEQEKHDAAAKAIAVLRAGGGLIHAANESGLSVSAVRKVCEKYEVDLWDQRETVGGLGRITWSRFQQRDWKNFCSRSHDLSDAWGVRGANEAANPEAVITEILTATDEDHAAIRDGLKLDWGSEWKGYLRRDVIRCWSRFWLAPRVVLSAAVVSDEQKKLLAEAYAGDLEIEFQIDCAVWVGADRKTPKVARGLVIKAGMVIQEILEATGERKFRASALGLKLSRVHTARIMRALGCETSGVFWTVPTSWKAEFWSSKLKRKNIENQYENDPSILDADNNLRTSGSRSGHPGRASTTAAIAQVETHT